MVVFVINKHGEALMPCKTRKARLLLKQKKAKIVNYKPFTIQLIYGSSGYKQKIDVGVDLGAKHVGLAITSVDKILIKGEIELRSDVKSLLETRKTYRRSRRARKTRYREARFLNRKKPKGWLPPSLESRVTNTFRWIDKFTSVLPNPTITIEVGKFDVQKMVNPAIAGVDYQRGQTYGYHDVRYFVFARDKYTCQVCRKKNKIVNTHHICYTSHGGSNRADNLITVCTDCHISENHKPGKVLWQWMKAKKKTKSYKETPFMNSLRKRVFKQYPDATITYGSKTTSHRKMLGLEKTHANDAIAITGIEEIIEPVGSMFKVKQFRKKKRSLHEATARKGRKTKNIHSKRNAKNTKKLEGFHLNDCVQTPLGEVGFITGFTGESACYIKSIEGEYITLPGKTYKQQPLKNLKKLNYNNNWQFISHLRYA